MSMSKKLFWDAPEKNKGPILEVLKKVIPEKFGDKSPIKVLEVAGGSGQHTVYFSKEIPELNWHPTDVDYNYIESMKAYIKEVQLPNIRPPVNLDISSFNVDNMSEIDKEYEMIIGINLIHISPWKCTEGLFKLAGELLTSGGILVTYGAYKINGEITPESNVRFNESLQAQNPEWGLRDIADLEIESKKNGLTFDAMFDMPANNKTLVWLKQKDVD